MSLEDEVRKIMRESVDASTPALEAYMKGPEGRLVTQDELFEVMIDRCNGIAKAVRRLAREIDDLRGSLDQRE